MGVLNVLRSIEWTERDSTVMTWDAMGMKLLNTRVEKENMTRGDLERENSVFKSFAA